MTGGRQVLVLVPTTVLAQPHAATFEGAWPRSPIAVEMVSRFRPPSEVKTALHHFQTSRVDVLGRALA